MSMNAPKKEFIKLQFELVHHMDTGYSLVHVISILRDCHSTVKLQIECISNCNIVLESVQNQNNVMIKFFIGQV